MAKNLLTDKEIRSARARAKPYHLRDGESLYCLVRKTQDGASRAWQFFFKWQGKTDRISLGAFPEVSLSEARKRRDKAREELAADPPLHPRLEALRREHDKIASDEANAAEKTVRTLFGDWERIYLASNRRDGGKECRAVFELDVFPVIGDTKAREVKKQHITALIDRPLGRGSRRRANMLLAMVKQFFSWAAVRGNVDVNPAAEFKQQHAGGKLPARERALSIEELRELASKLPACGLGESQQAAICLLLATGARVGELNKAEWPEFDTEARTWTIPKGHTRELRQHVVHLSDFALEQLEILKRYRRNDDEHVLLSMKSKKPIEDKALTKAIRDRQRDTPHKGRSTRYTNTLKLSGGDWSIHDLRRTMATRMGDLQIPPHIVEKCLSHKMTGVMAIYNRNEYMPERKAAFEAWGAQLARIFSGADNVVEFAPRGSKTAA